MNKETLDYNSYKYIDNDGIVLIEKDEPALISIEGDIDYLTKDFDCQLGLMSLDFTIEDTFKKYAVVVKNEDNEQRFVFDGFNETPKSGDKYIIDSNEYAITNAYYAGDNNEEGWENASNTNESTRKWGINANSVKYIDVETNISPTTMSGWFYNFQSLEQINGIENIDTSNVVSMRKLFDNCKKLTYVDISKWNTSSVTNMERMFGETTNILDVNGIESINTYNVTTFSDMFSNSSITKDLLDLTNWNVSNTITMNGMFYYIHNIKKYDLSGWDVSKVTATNNMFQSYYGYSSAKEIDLSDWKPIVLKNTESMFASNYNNLVYLKGLKGWKFDDGANLKNMFYSTRKIEDLDLSDWEFGKNTNVNNMLDDMVNLNHINVDNWNIQNVSNASSLFSRFNSLETIDLSTWNFQEKMSDCSSMFSNTSIKTIYVKNNLDLSQMNQQDRYNFFNNNNNLVGGQGTVRINDQSKYAKVDGLNGEQGYFTPKIYYNFYNPTTNQTSDPELYYFGVKAPELPSKEYKGWSYEKDATYSEFLPGENIVYSSDNINDFTLYPCEYSRLDRYAIVTENNDNPTTHTLSFDRIRMDAEVGVDTYNIDGEECKIVDVYFAGDSKTTGWENSTVTESQNQYWKEYSDSINRVNINIRILPRTTSFWFYNMPKMKSIDLSNLDTGNVTNMNFMFSNSGFESLDLTNFNVSKVEKIENTFSHCSSLRSIDMTGWGQDTKEITSAFGMLNYCFSVEEIKGINDWNISKLNDMSYMFAGCMEYLDLSKWSRSGVNMEGMFNGCRNLETLDISGMGNPSNSVNVRYMFANCPVKTIYTIRTANWSGVTNSENMFSYCGAVGGLGTKVSDVSSAYAVVDGFKLNSSTDPKPGYFTPKIKFSYYNPATNTNYNQTYYKFGIKAEGSDVEGFVGWGYTKDSDSVAIAENENVLYNPNNINDFVLYPVTGQVFAIYSQDDNSLRFYNEADIPKEEEIYKDLTVTDLYTDIEETSTVANVHSDWYNDQIGLYYVEGVGPCDFSSDAPGVIRPNSWQ